jgi:hypothetical protein
VTPPVAGLLPPPAQDDQDILLGGALPTSSAFSPNATPLPRTKVLLMDQGAALTNMFIHTPVCCALLPPSPHHAL